MNPISFAICNFYWLGTVSVCLKQSNGHMKAWSSSTKLLNREAIHFSVEVLTGVGLLKAI